MTIKAPKNPPGPEGDSVAGLVPGDAEPAAVVEKVVVAPDVEELPPYKPPGQFVRVRANVSVLARGMPYGAGDVFVHARPQADVDIALGRVTVVTELEDPEA